MFNRRDFLKAAATASSVGFSSTVHSLTSRRQESSGFFGVHPFVEKHPEAVFIMHTKVDDKTNSEAKLNAGLDFSRSVIVPRSEEDGGVPLTNLIPVKPNLTCRGTWDTKYTVEKTMSVVTDSYFVEGVIEGIKELGLKGSQFYIREVNCPENFETDGYGNPWNNGSGGIAERTGAEIRDMSKVVGIIDENDVVWKDIPNGVYFRKIPYIWPVNAENSWLLNIAKLKAHGMGITLTCKNLQGTVVHNYQRFGSGYHWIDMKEEHKQPTGLTDIKNSYELHKGIIPRWDRPGTTWNSGIGMETWAHMTIDSHSVTKPALNVVEGIYSRDGNGFVRGPGEGELAQEFLTNIIIFGMNPFHVDNIGHWIASQEPGNFGLFHIAVERGLARTINPHEIPVYEWFADGSAQLTPLDDFPRTPLMTYYLQRDYNGQTEPYYHLCDEPFTYQQQTGIDETAEPKAAVLNQNYPNPFNPYTSIEYSLPRTGNVLLEIYNATGQRIDVLVDGKRIAGTHVAVWNTNNQASGVYFYRLQFGAFSELRKMTLVK
ncbi:DUF362 domain-containing protein [bacterium]|nr:DUF362 domain-containing protein [bacterium]